jgi:hypothetical protein
MRKASVQALAHEGDPRMRVLFDDRLMAVSKIDALRARHVWDGPPVSFPYDRHLPVRGVPFQGNGPVPARDALLASDRGAEAKALLIVPLVTEAVACTRPVGVATHGRSQLLPRYPHP